MVNGDGIKSYDVKKDKIAAGVKMDKYMLKDKNTKEESESDNEKITPIGWKGMLEKYEQEEEIL